MKKLLTICVCLLGITFVGAQGCWPRDPDPVVPSVLGGAPGTGGAATGGAMSSAGGSAATGGGVAVGGSSPVVVEFPRCNPDSRQAAPLVRHPLGRVRGAIKARPRASYRVVEGIEPRFWSPLIASALNQLNLGSCTGNGPTQIRLHRPYSMVTLPPPWNAVTSAVEFEKLAVDVYSGATLIDPWPGSYPPDDTGSNGKSAMTVAVQRGLFTGFRPIDNFDDLQKALQNGPCIFGSNWTAKMFAPDRCGQIQPEGTVEGGHEYGLVGIEVERKLIWAVNSWGDDWGVSWHQHGGYFNLTFGDFLALFNSGGEIECPDVPSAADNVRAFRWAQ